MPFYEHDLLLGIDMRHVKYATLNVIIFDGGDFYCFFGRFDDCQLEVFDDEIIASRNEMLISMD